MTTDARPHVEALAAAITGPLAPTKVLAWDKVPGSFGNDGTLPATYVLASVERRYNPLLRLPARAGSVGWRISLRCLGKQVWDVRRQMSHIADALNEQRLSIDGRLTTPLQFESEQAPDWDDARWSALVIYTYAH